MAFTDSSGGSLPFPAVRALVASILVLALAGCGGGGSSSTAATSSRAASTSTPINAVATASGQIGFENVPIEPGPPLAPNTTQTGVVDGISCGATEQLAYHIHAHLMVFVDGQPRSLTGGIGIPGSVVQPTTKGPAAFGGQCIYWLHTHAPDGVIHIESPTPRIYTLGDFFNEWHQPLTSDDVAGARGKVSAFVNGRPWTRSPRAIPLDPHAVIQLDVGTPLPPFQQVNWARTEL
jgi:hypothetical protein